MDSAAAVRMAMRPGGTETVFQPIGSLEDGREFGYEALSRPRLDPPMDRPDAVLAAAETCGLSVELDRCWREQALASAATAIPEHSLLFINVLPRALTEHVWTPAAAVRLVRGFGFSPDRIVIELTERDSISDFDAIRRMVGQMRAAGFLVAIDDVGAGSSTLQAVAELRPDFVKLDRWLTNGIGFDSARRSIVESMVRLAQSTRARVIAEGIERLDELENLAGLGVDFGQGYLLGVPHSKPPGVSADAVAGIVRARQRVGERDDAAARRTAGDLATPTLWFPGTLPSSALWDAFESDELLDAVAVDLGRTIGFVTRHRAYRMLGGQFGYSLRAKRPVEEFAERAFTIDASDSLREAAQVALRRPTRFRHDPLAVLEADRYVGAIDVADLFACVLTHEVNDARDVNPLTGLPGNRLIRREVSRAMSGDEPVVCLYVDIDHFKVFNDRYGFAAGDLAIAELGLLLQRAVRDCRADAFVGHIGGDDFVLLLGSEDAFAVEAGLRAELADRWFDPERRTAAERLTVSACGVSIDSFHGTSYEELAGGLAKLKSHLKRAGGDRIVIPHAVAPGCYADAA